MYPERFLATLRQKVADELTAKHNELGGGSKFIANDAAATGMACARVMGEIAAYKTTLLLIDQVQDELSGKTKGKL